MAKKCQKRQKNHFYVKKLQVFASHIPTLALILHHSTCTRCKIQSSFQLCHSMCSHWRTFLLNGQALEHAKSKIAMGNFMFFFILRLTVAQSLHTRHDLCVKFDYLLHATIAHVIWRRLFVESAKTIFPKCDQASQKRPRPLQFSR